MFLPILLSAQTSSKKIKLDVPIKDFSGSSTLTVYDIRKNKDIGKLVYKGDAYDFSFENKTAKEDIERWFSKQNKKKGGRGLILLIQNLNVYNTYVDNTNFCKLKINLATFLKKDSLYYVLKRYEDVLEFSPKETNGIPTALSKGIEKILQNVVSKSFKDEPYSKAFTEMDMVNYYNVLLDNVQAYSQKELIDGVYTDEKSFFDQKPLKYRLVRDEKGIFVKAENPNNLDEKLRAHKIYAYVENGKAYKNTLEGFIPFTRDENGFYIESNRKLIYPDMGNNTYGIVGALFGGILGGVIGGVVDGIKAQSEFNRAKLATREKVYVDFLNGQYIFKD
ncbi:hypothetical protein [Epilithonimonas sp.]|uniref:hypothetical protein n=1 Tax=Epilithonimonas sp. TaxID=2894511 RepID=UPI0035ADE98C